MSSIGCKRRRYSAQTFTPQEARAAAGKRFYVFLRFFSNYRGLVDIAKKEFVANEKNGIDEQFIVE